MYDVVIATENLENTPKGSKGTILEVYGNDDYEVEFIDENGESLSVITVNIKFLAKRL